MTITRELDPRIAKTLDSLVRSVSEYEEQPTVQSAQYLMIESRVLFTSTMDFWAWTDGGISPGAIDQIRRALNNCASALKFTQPVDAAISGSFDYVILDVVRRCEAFDVFVSNDRVAINEFMAHRRLPGKATLAEFGPSHYEWLAEDPDRIRRMRPDEFEELVADRFHAMGLGVKLVGPTKVVTLQPSEIGLG